MLAVIPKIICVFCVIQLAISFPHPLLRKKAKKPDDQKPDDQKPDGQRPGEEAKPFDWNSALAIGMIASNTLKPERPKQPSYADTLSLQNAQYSNNFYSNPTSQSAIKPITIA